MVMALRHSCYENYEKEDFECLKTVEKYLAYGSEGAVGTGIKNTAKWGDCKISFLFFPPDSKCSWINNKNMPYMSGYICDVCHFSNPGKTCHIMIIYWQTWDICGRHISPENGHY